MIYLIYVIAIGLTLLLMYRELRSEKRKLVYILLAFSLILTSVSMFEAIDNFDLMNKVVKEVNRYQDRYIITVEDLYGNMVDIDYGTEKPKLGSTVTLYKYYLKTSLYEEIMKIFQAVGTLILITFVFVIILDREIRDWVMGK